MTRWHVLAVLLCCLSSALVGAALGTWVDL